MENCKAPGLPVEIYRKELLTGLPGGTDPEVIVSLTQVRIAAALSPRSLSPQKRGELPPLITGDQSKVRDISEGTGLPRTRALPH